MKNKARILNGLHPPDNGMNEAWRRAEEIVKNDPSKAIIPNIESFRPIIVTKEQHAAYCKMLEDCMPKFDKDNKALGKLFVYGTGGPINNNNDFDFENLFMNMEKKLEICAGCNTEKVTWKNHLGKKYCQSCWNRIKPPAPIKKALIKQKVYEPTGESDVFREVLDNLPDTETVCFVCGIRITVVTAHNFAHVLSKSESKYPRFKLYAKNIKLLCHRFIADDNGFQGCHFAWDHQPRSKLVNDPNWGKMFELEQELKNEYRKL